MSTTGINLDYTLNIRVLTPIHVGGSQEKHLYEGLDFIREHSKVYLIDQQKLLDKMNPVDLAETMLSGQSGALKIALQRERVPLKDVCQEEPMFVEDVQFSEIKAFIKDGLRGKPFVPGSSLKGAIRSIVFAHLRGKSKYENEVLGLFERSIFRHINVGDAFFDQLVLYPSKTFNLQGYQQSLKGGWRHGNGNTNATFSPTGSVFVYECLPAGTAGQLSLRILDHQSGLFQNLQQWDRHEQTRERGRSLPEGLTSIIQAKPLEHLFSLINNTL